MKTILITGASGFIGKYLVSKFKSKYKIIGIDFNESENSGCDVFYNFDITDHDKVKQIFKNHKIHYVVHSAAEKNLIYCEYNPKKAYETNFIASELLYNLTKIQNGKFIFISSDQVFDGIEGEYHENSQTNPINYYGVLKEKFENMIKEDINTAICRTALVFGMIPKNQIKYFDKIKSEDYLIVQGYIVQHVIHKLLSKEEIKLPKNEFMSPTYIELFYQQIKQVIKNNISGILHCCGSERISRYDFGMKIAKTFDLDDKYIQSTNSNDKLRPKDVSFNFKVSMDKLGIKYTDIDTMLEKLKYEINKEKII